MVKSWLDKVEVAVNHEGECQMGMACKGMIVALMLLGFTSAVFAQEAGTEWGALNEEALKLYRAGKYDRAVVVAEKALEVAQKNAGPDHPAVGTILNTLAINYHEQGQYAQAEPLYERALAIRE